MPEDLSLALPPSGAAAVHRVDPTSSRMVRDQLASGRPDIGLLWELCLRVLDSACGEGRNRHVLA